MKIVLDNEGFLYYKFINALVFTENYDMMFEDFFTKYGKPSLATLAILNAIVLNLGDIIDNNMERNILNMVNYFKVDYSCEHEDEKNDIFNICNEIIGYVNDHNFKGEEASIYCAEQLALRGYSMIDRVILTGGKRLLSTFDFIKKLQVQDLLVIATLYGDKSGNLYNLKKEEYGDPSYTYITSIKISVEENPYYLDDKLFLQRLKEIVEIYEKNLKTYKPEKNEKIKSLKKYFKDFKKELKESTNK